MTVLVTGGAGYIGSHMVHALVDAGERVVVLDNLSTGFEWAMPKACRWSSAIPATRRWSPTLIKQHGVEAIIHFAASIVVPDRSPIRSATTSNNTVNSRALIECAVKGGVQAFHLLLDRGGLRQSGARAGDRGRRR